MADYWKSIEKKRCDACNCWITNNKSSVEFHESGRRHKENVQNRLKAIYKKNRNQEKKDRRFEIDMRKIEEAAKASYMKDKEDNPDISLKAELYKEKFGIGLAQGSGQEPTESSSSSSPVKIAHRSSKKVESQKDKNSSKPAYNRFGGWETVKTSSTAHLELPSRPTMNFVPKTSEKKKPVEFSEKKLPPRNPDQVKEESSITFKKRKMSNFNIRSRKSSD